MILAAQTSNDSNQVEPSVGPGIDVHGEDREAVSSIDRIGRMMSNAKDSLRPFVTHEDRKTGDILYRKA